MSLLIFQQKWGLHMSLHEVKCPMCKGTLWIDLASGKIVDHKSSEHAKANFEDFLKSRGKETAWDEKMRRAKEDEKKRKEEIELKFKGVKDEPVERSEDNPFKNPLDWD